ncbi:unnamed protein product, partial [Polarella glacialis]
YSARATGLGSGVGGSGGFLAQFSSAALQCVLTAMKARGSHMVRCTEALGEAPLAHRGGGSLTRASRALQDLEAHVLEHQLGSVVPLLAARRLRQ